MKETRQTKWYSLTNSLIFAMVMQDEDLCIALLNRILPEKKIRTIRFPEPLTLMDSAVETEKTFVTSVYAKSIRVDVIFEGEDDWFNLEIQIENQFDMPPRSRYYHALIATSILDKGEDYTQLKPGYVIFICMFDYFKQDKAVYSFEMYDRKNDLLLGDGQATIILNVSCPEENVPEELRTFFAYLKTGEVDEDDPLILRMDELVREANRDERVRRAMTLEEQHKHDLYIAKRDGRAEGKAEEATKFSSLILRLTETGRSEDLVKAAEDSDYREKLFAEFGL